MSVHNGNSLEQELYIKNRKLLTLNGVINVEEFGENYLTICTDCGIVYVEGREMRIESLTKDTGSLVVVGNIDGVYYKSSSDSKGWISKFFK